MASGVSVRKVWVNQDGSQISDPTGSIKVQLYKSTGKIDGANVTVKWANYSDSNANIRLSGEKREHSYNHNIYWLR